MTTTNSVPQMPTGFPLKCAECCRRYGVDKPLPSIMVDQGPIFYRRTDKGWRQYVPSDRSGDGTAWCDHNHLLDHTQKWIENAVEDALWIKADFGLLEPTVPHKKAASNAAIFIDGNPVKRQEGLRILEERKPPPPSRDW